MKKWILLFIIICLTTTACTNSPHTIKFDHADLSKELKKEGINPKLPTQFPMKVEKYEIQRPPHESVIHEIMFTGENGEIFNLRVHTGEVTFGEDMKEEEVEISGDQGFFSDHDAAGLEVVWEDGEYTYLLNYQTVGLDTEVTKETMIGVAESFK
ncbi:hypothetical protein [Bacillus sp. KH172YL63]|uniref:hypothetical protein n=1 Tax=Bacillus sp. KH172YL63 TaxID=2709784 RepID=UPI0013E444D1|nr:hypothetical protein [Bacillus sp. KH172YL63]BCB03962.1 hypothetical protein KH172YL63_20950 [Bacillus sp. KH172YL63]